MSKSVEKPYPLVADDDLQGLLRDEYGRRFLDKVEMPPYFATCLKPSMKLRPYQTECFQYFLTYWEEDCEYRSKNPQLLFHMATGSGKTLIMAGAMLYLYEKGYRNFLFFVPSTNIIEKTKENFLNPASPKYLFAPQINIGQKQVEIKLVDNFQGVDENSINLCLTTTQGLHISLNTPKENSLTYDDFANQSIVLISDEAHHINTATKKGKKAEAPSEPGLFADDFSESEDWETTVMRIFHGDDGSTLPNILLEFTATMDLTDPHIAEKYKNKIIFNYPLKKFREDGYSKDIEVVQSDLSPIDRAIQTVILNQYKRKLFAAIGQDIKPVMMLKSKTIAENKKFYELFCNTIKHLAVEDITKVQSGAKGDVLEAFTYFTEKGITFDNLLLEIKEDFKEENLLLVDGNNISPEKQIKLNTLEAKDNEFRAVFAVDMLNEGWDVLNLFDIVRLYETRDSDNNKPGKTTMQEAQLIGRGARYMPFQAPTGDQPVGQRKFDSDITNRLRVVEKLHYHSAHNPKYINELHNAMVQTGIVAPKTKEVELKLKDEFKKTKLYKDGYVFMNEPEFYLLNEEVTSLGEAILSKTYKVRIHSGEMKTSLIFGKATTEDMSLKYVPLKMKDLGQHILRSAINRFDGYKFSALKETFPKLKSIKEFIESDSFLSNIDVQVFGRDDIINDLSQKNKLLTAVEVLRQIEPLLSKGGVGKRGSKQFVTKMFKDVFKDHVLKFSIDDNSDKQYGKPMLEAANLFLTTDIKKCKWYAYNECYGTSEEKHLIKYVEAMYSKLCEKYDDIYLVRNEKDLKLYSIEGDHIGEACEPDYLLFLTRKPLPGVMTPAHYDNIQIFIEPKGDHLRATDKWKEDFFKTIRDKAEIRFSTQSSTFNIWGLPFYTNSHEAEFTKAFNENLEL